MNEYLRVFRALSDENRIKILEKLSEGEQCACCLLEGLGISQSTLGIGDQPVHAVAPYEDPVRVRACARGARRRVDVLFHRRRGLPPCRDTAKLCGQRRYEALAEILQDYCAYYKAVCQEETGGRSG